MILERGDIFSMWGKTHLFLFTSNNCVRKDGLAVMGAGMAKSVADRAPAIQRMFGEHLLSERPPRYCGLIGSSGGQQVGFFMTKNDWKKSSDLGIIKNSVTELLIILHAYKGITGVDLRVDLNFPGINNGRLKREDVLPLIQRLPDNVHIWEYDGKENTAIRGVS